MSNINDPFQTFTEPEDIRLEPGMVLGDDYELVKQVGRGGMGVVWKAKDRSGERYVALKFVPPDVQRFEAEMKRLKQSFASIHELQDRHICPVYALKQHPIFGYYLVMKWIEGETLDRLLLRHKNGMDLETVVKILEPIAAALDYAHGRKIIHRDIKPSNIFVQMDGTEIRDVQLIDFGLAKEIRSSMIRVSQAGADMAGTQLYMSPEQWRGRRQTAAADQYALTVVAYEMLAGYPPFESDDKDILRRAVLEETPEKITGVSAGVRDVLLKGLAKDAVDRYGSCREFATDLKVEASIRLGYAAYYKWEAKSNDQAILAFTEAIRLKPDCAEAYKGRGDAYDRKGEYDRAIADYTDAIRLEPYKGFYYAYRGMTYDRKKEYDPAISDFSEAIRLSETPKMKYLFYVERSRIYMAKGDYDRAISDCTEMIQIFPDSSHIYEERGRAYNKKGDYGKSVADFTEAIRIEPDDVETYRKRGYSYYKQGDYDRAIADYTEVIRLEPNDGLTYEKRGWLYQALGKTDLAEADYAMSERLTDEDS